MAVAQPVRGPRWWETSAIVLVLMACVGIALPIVQWRSDCVHEMARDVPGYFKMGILFAGIPLALLAILVAFVRRKKILAEQGSEGTSSR